MKKLRFVFILIFLFSCGNNNSDNSSSSINKPITSIQEGSSNHFEKYYEIDGDKFIVVELEGCEYFSATIRHFQMHKGNCKNPIHYKNENLKKD